MYDKLLSLQIALLTLASWTRAHWSYHSQKDGSEWVGDCTVGMRQSPIAAESSTAIPTVLDPMIFEFYDQPPKSDLLKNNGHSVTFRIEPIREINYPQVVGGGLPGVYQFDQLHFHWGSEDRKGSEHTIDGRHYPMELHAVHFNTKFGSSLIESLKNAGKAYNALAVLAVMFEVQDEDNPLIQPIVDELDNVHYLHEVTSNVTLFPLDNLLPHTTSKFFRYNGSLTTPPCSEIVVWTIFQDPILISKNQLNKFRALEDLPKTSTTTHHTQSDKFREIQPLNGRPVYLVDTSHISQRNQEVKTIIYYICIIVCLLAFIVICVLIILIVLYYINAPNGIRTQDQRTGANTYLPVRKSNPENTEAN